MYLIGHAVVEVGASDPVLGPHWLANNNLVDIIELIPIFITENTKKNMLSQWQMLLSCLIWELSPTTPTSLEKWEVPFQLILMPWTRHLARNCLKDRQFPENLLFREAKLSMKNYDFLWVITKSFHNKELSEKCLKSEMHLWHISLLNVVGIRIW